MVSRRSRSSLPGRAHLDRRTPCRTRPDQVLVSEAGFRWSFPPGPAAAAHRGAGVAPATAPHGLGGGRRGRWLARRDGGAPPGVERLRPARVRVVVREEEPAGGNRCRNLGFAASTGEFLIFLDDDDALSRAAWRSTCGGWIRAGLDFGISPYQHFHTHPGDMPRVVEALPGQDDLERYLRVDIPWQTAGALWRRDALLRLGPWDEALPC